MAKIRDTEHLAEDQRSQLQALRRNAASIHRLKDTDKKIQSKIQTLEAQKKGKNIDQVCAIDKQIAALRASSPVKDPKLLPGHLARLEELKNLELQIATLARELNATERRLGQYKQDAKEVKGRIFFITEDAERARTEADYASARVKRAQASCVVSRDEIAVISGNAQLLRKEADERQSRLRAVLTSLRNLVGGKEARDFQGKYLID